MVQGITNLKRFNSRAKERSTPFDIDSVWIDKEVANHPQTLRILNKLSHIDADVIENRDILKRPCSFEVAKKRIFLTTHRGEAFKSCQGIGSGHLCCNYKILDLASGCPMDCSYCILQSYLANNPITTIYVNIEDILANVSSFLKKHPNKFFRIGTGELSDSLALDFITDYSNILITFFAAHRNAILELKTKTAFIDNLLDLNHKNHTVISWSVNTPEIIAAEEKNTATLEERIAAAKKVAEAGYGVGFHFDPIIINNEEADLENYSRVIDKIFESIKPDQISWISLGLLRFPPDLPSIVRKRFPETKIFNGELIPAGGKIRYLRFIRERAYRVLWDKLSQKLPPHKLYLCMETETVWQKIDPSIKSNLCMEKRLCSADHSLNVL